MNREAPLTDIKIWQQNTRRSLDAQLALINSLENQYDIVCIQEPHFDFRNISRATRVWHTIYPTALPNNEDRPPSAHAHSRENFDQQLDPDSSRLP
jgi:hypothetical protein